MWTYEIWCGEEVYIGFTSRPPTTRLGEHLEEAFTRCKTRFHKTLKANGITDYVKVKHPDEIAALKHEILEIAKYKEKGIALNSTSGGEGNNYRVKLMKSGDWQVKKVSEKIKKSRRAWMKSKSRVKKSASWKVRSRRRRR